MMLQNKLDRAMNWLKEKNKPKHSYNEECSGKHLKNSSETDNFDPKAEWKVYENSNLELEKIDVVAIILSALMVFGPIILILLIILVLVSNF